MSSAFLHGQGGGKSVNNIYIWEDNGQWEVVYTESTNLAAGASNVKVLDLPDGYNCYKFICSFGAFSGYQSGGSRGYGPEFSLYKNTDNTFINVIAESSIYVPTGGGNFNNPACTYYNYLYKAGNYFGLSGASISDTYDIDIQQLLKNQSTSITIASQKFNLIEPLSIYSSFSIPSNMSSSSCPVTIQVYGQK